MENFKDRAIKAKLNFMVVVAIGLMAILGIGALFGAYELNAQTKELHNWLKANNIVAEIDYLTSEVRLKQYAHVISSTTAEFTQHEKEIEDLKTKLNGLITEYETTIESEIDRQYYEAACAAWEDYLQETGEEFISLSRAMKLDEANAIMLGGGLEAFNKFQVNCDELLEYNHAQAEEASDYATSTFIFVVVIVIVLVAIATVIALGVSRVIIKGIITPVDELKRAAAEMTQGRLDAEINYESKDELGELADSIREVQTTLGSYVREISATLEVIASGDLTKDFNQITEFRGEFNSVKTSFVRILKEFNITLGKISEGAMDVDHCSDEIAGAAGDLATGTGEQASAVEELTATITTVSNMAEDSAKAANEASDEAARAGDAGRGFAVVADQIGKLAADSAKAVVNTKELIDKTVQAVDKGSAMTETAALGFGRIIEELESFAEMAHGVNESATAQAQALRQVEEGIEQISTVTQQNAAASEECSAISEELAARATEMTNQIQKFNLFD